MCVIRAFNYVITIFKIKRFKVFTPHKPHVFLGDEISHAQIFNERDKWRTKCLEQSKTYMAEITRLHRKLDKYVKPDLS